MKKITISLMAIGVLLTMNGCGAIDDFKDEPIHVRGEGVVYTTDGSIWGITTANLRGDAEGYALWDVDQTKEVGKITIDRTVLNTNGDFVGNCVPDAPENSDAPDFTDSGYLQGSCTLHN